MPNWRSAAWLERSLPGDRICQRTDTQIPLNLPLLKGCSIVGVFWGRFTGEEPKAHLQNIGELWELFATGKLNPVVTDVFPLEQYPGRYQLHDRAARPRQGYHHHVVAGRSRAMQGFEFNTVKRIISGAGSALQLAEQCRRLGIARLLLVTDPGLMAIGLVQPVMAAMEGEGLCRSF